MLISKDSATGQDAALLHPLIAALGKSISFYRQAATTAQSHQNRNTFARIAQSREDILSRLKPLEKAAPDSGYTFGSALQKMYPDMIRALQAQSDHPLVRQAYRLEEEILHRLQNAMEGVQSATLKAVLKDIFPQANGEQVLYSVEYAC